MSSTETEQSHSQFFTRLSSYPIMKDGIESLPPNVKSFGEGVLHRIPSVPKFAQPYFARADEIADRQLGALEPMMKSTASKMQSFTMEPVSKFQKDKVAPLVTSALDYAESWCNYLLPTPAPTEKSAPAEAAPASALERASMISYAFFARTKMTVQIAVCSRVMSTVSKAKATRDSVRSTVCSYVMPIREHIADVYAKTPETSTTLQKLFDTSKTLASDASAWIIPRAKATEASLQKEVKDAYSAAISSGREKVEKLRRRQ